MTRRPRADCPLCHRSLSLPSGRFAAHVTKRGGTYCPASHMTIEEARIESLEWETLEAQVRGALAGNTTALAALDDLVAKCTADCEDGSY